MILGGYHLVAQSNLCMLILLLKQLKKDPGQPAAYGLLKKINKVKFIGAVYIFKWILPILATLNKSFQKGAINYASIKPSIDYSKDRLKDVKITEEPIKQLKQDLSSGGRLETLELVCIESNVRDLQGLLQKYIKALVKKDLLVSYIPGRYLRSAKKNLLAVPGFKLNSYGRRAFSVAAPLLWNSLPQHVRDAELLDIFKRQLKTVLFKRAFLN